MNDTAIMHIAVQALLVAGKLAAPVLITSLVIGFAVSLFQSATQIQEFTLAFVPKVIGISLALLICGHWMLTTMISFTTQLFHGIPQLLG
ncbi:MAG TPA: flagellar biosynthesis protein FliQ [Jatrophihabitans sp.]|jgi:flagellar biosynthetic protein FliQ|nr:flagellar biosynthesis protein FliQ [Jatrophihabitans sp.]